MSEHLDETISVLENLVGFDSISLRPTAPIVTFIQNYLAEQEIEATLSFEETGERSNVFATIGPKVDGGVVLSGHFDVVPVDGQDWSSDPFILTRREDRLYGRGSVDMKGFLACVLGSVPVFKAADLKKPIHIAFSFDEEVGGFGMPVLLDAMEQNTYRPEIVIVGEPTNMKLITGHKGGYEMRTEIIGQAVHSSNPLLGVNAISAATKLIAKIEEIAARTAAAPFPDSPFEPPYCTFNIGTIEGGSATNATAGWCNFKWEFRPMPGEDGEQYVDEVKAYAANELLPPMKAVFPDADVRIITETPVPALDNSNAAKAASFVSEITGINSQDVVSFGTDAGYFSDAGISTVVFGPGDIDRAHKEDEFIKVSELQQGLDFLEKVAQRLSR
ncbi:MAG: acetylornithine deacetylase [Pseudomonadota bacterium]